MSFQRNVRHAFLAGFCGSAGSLFGKLSGGFSEYNDPWVFRLICLGLMIGFNAAVWVFFVKALVSSESSLTATVISSATNYLCSVFVGSFLFGEASQLLWWCGAPLVIIGLVLIAKDDTPITNKKKLT